MKTKLITTLKKELLIIEAKNESIAWAMIFNEWGSKEVLKWTLLGKADEIKEEDVSEFVEQSIFTSLYGHYVKDIPVNTYCYRNALESFNSALESEIYWINPVSLERADHYRKAGNEFSYNGIMKCWNKAQEKTFDKKRTLIFVKN